MGPTLTGIFVTNKNKIHIHVFGVTNTVI